tara:strand:+ start:100 stop:396 length:297 start_codon:yes stop_codon:yes gene_type:complete
MAITYIKEETFDGTRMQTMPDPDNEGETLSETLTGITDILVRFTEDSTSPGTVHSRMVNVCFAADGTTYDEAATDARIAEVGAGVAHKIALGVIVNAT